jgi:hypothetical protein
MAVHVLLLAVPAVAAGGFMQAFQYTFLLWPFNLALPLARHLPRACAVLRQLAAFYDAELRPYASGARRAARRLPTPPRTTRHASLRDEHQRAAHDDIVANAMIALVEISY